MLAEAIESLIKLAKGRRPVTVEVAGQHYAVRNDETLGDPIRPLAPQWIKPIFEVSTLTALVALVENKLDGIAPEDKRIAVHVVDPFRVQVVSLHADDYGRRHLYAEATHEEEFPFHFNKFYEPEPFLISFRAAFLFNEEAMKVQQLCSTVTAANSVGIADDGVSQEVTVKEGTVIRSSVVLPSDGIPLIAHRTFRDARAVTSKYLLRMDGKSGGLPKIALFDIDHRWELDTVHSIQDYLEGNLPKDTIIIA